MRRGARSRRFIENENKRMIRNEMDLVVAQAAQRVQGALRVQHDLSVFANEYQELIHDHRLRSLTGANVDALLARDAQDGIAREPIDVFREAGNHVREWASSIAGRRSANAEPRQRSARPESV